MITRSIFSLCWLILTSSFHRLHQSNNLLRQRTVIFDQSSDNGAPPRKKRYDDNEIDFLSVLRKCKYSNDYQPAIELAEKALLLRPMPPSILTGVIKVFGEAGQLGRAVSLLKVMKEELNVMPNEYHLGALIAACRRCGQWEMGVVLYNRMDSLNVVKNTIICNNIISTLGDALQWQSVFEILAEMDTLNIKKDIVTYSSAITACVKAGEWERAITLYRMMEKEGIKTNTITLNAVLSACARGRQVRMALDLFSEACKLGVPLDTISYSVVIKVCGDINEFEVALCLFNAMSDDVAESSVTETSKSILRKDILSNWNSSSASQFSKEYVSEILRTCRKVPRDTGCYNSIITCCERAGKWETAVDILDSMMKNKGGRTRPDSKTFSAAISCCGKAGQWEEATRIFNQMAAEGFYFHFHIIVVPVHSAFY
jgi:pentatricopeptide repeat protein